MTKLLPEYKRSTVYALIGAVFHVVVVVLPLTFMDFSDNCCGEFLEVYAYFIWFVLYLPFLFIFSTIFEQFPQIGPPGTINNFFFFTIIGTLFYTLNGWLIGYLTDKYSQLWSK